MTISFSGKAYRILVDLIYEHSRIRLGADKQTLLANRLQKRLRAAGLEFLRRLLRASAVSGGVGRNRGTGGPDLHQPHEIFP